jgi:hypothetical protein
VRITFLDKLTSLPFSIYVIVGVFDRQPTKGSTLVDECGLAEIGNSKEETRGTQFRQAWAVRCVIPYILYVV